MLALTLTLLQEAFSVCQMAPSEPIPSWATQGTFYSITKTTDELSIVCPSEEVPSGITCEKGWIMYRVEGPLDFGLTGVLSSIAKPLTDEKVSIFAISSYDTDYILVKESNREKSLKALTAANFIVQIPDSKAD